VVKFEPQSQFDAPSVIRPFYFSLSHNHRKVVAFRKHFDASDVVSLRSSSYFAIRRVLQYDVDRQQVDNIASLIH